MATVRTKRGARGSKSVSETLNQEYAAALAAPAERMADEDEWDKPGIDQFNEGEGEPSEEAPTRKRPRREGAGRLSSQLRKRAPLDPALSQGAYAAVPVSSAEVESKLDRIFDMFEGSEGDAEPDGGKEEERSAESAPSGGNADSKPKRRRSAKGPLGEEELEKWAKSWQETETHAQLKRLHKAIDEKDAASDADGDEARKIERQISELRQLQIGAAGVRAGAQLEITPTAAQSEQTDEAKMLQRAIGQLLQIRLKLQRCLTTAVQLPQYYSKPEFVKTAGDEARQLYESIGKNVRALIGDLFCSGGLDWEVPKKLVALDAALGEFHSSVMERANAYIDAISSHVVPSVPSIASSKKAGEYHAIARPLREQIRGVLEGGLLQLRNKLHRNRTHSKILGHPTHSSENTSERALRIAEGDTDEEIFDDPDFLQELLHRNAGMVLNSGVQEEATEDYLRRLSGNIVSRVGLHRKTKGKSISLVPRPKLVGFMAPIPCSASSTEALPALLNSLFQ